MHQQQQKKEVNGYIAIDNNKPSPANQSHDGPDQHKIKSVVHQNCQ